VGLVFGVLWEIRVSQPVLDVRMLKDRTFAVANTIMFTIGIVLFGTTIILPLFSQQMLGYTAERAGLAITPGGFWVMGMMPLVGFLLGHVPARYLVMLGMAISATAIYRMTRFDLSVSFSTLMWARIFQASGLAFLFVPINMAAYASLARNKSNDASAMLNLFRNVGGSVGISLVTTIVARRSQFHQTVLASHVTPFNLRVQQMLGGASGAMSAHGGSSQPFALLQAERMLYTTVQRQAQMLSYIDAFFLLSVFCACMIPLLFLMKNNRPGAAPGGH